MEHSELPDMRSLAVSCDGSGPNLFFIQFKHRKKGHLFCLKHTAPEPQINVLFMLWVKKSVYWCVYSAQELSQTHWPDISLPMHSCQSSGMDPETWFVPSATLALPWQHLAQVETCLHTNLLHCRFGDHIEGREGRAKDISSNISPLVFVLGSTRSCLVAQFRLVENNSPWVGSHTSE